MTGARFRFWLTSVVLFSWVLLGWPPIFSFAPGIQNAEAAISLAVSNVNPGWSDSTKRVVFYNGSLIFLLYTKGDGNIYYKSSVDNVSWSAESTLITSASDTFDMYLVNDTKLDLAYYGAPSNAYVRTCTISGATITCGNPSTVTNLGFYRIAVARSGGDRIHVLRRFNTYFYVFSADQTGDAQNVTSWTRSVSTSDSCSSTTAGCQDMAIVPYQNADKVLAVYTSDRGGTNNDGVYSWVITGTSGAGEIQVGNYDSLPRLSSPIRISDTDFRIIVKNPSTSLDEWTFNGTSWTGGVSFDGLHTDQGPPSLFYDPISGDMYAFSVLTGTNVVNRNYKPSGGSWQPGVVADGGEATAKSFPITQMHEPPLGSSRTLPRQLVWAYRVANGSNYDLKVGTLSLAGCGVVAEADYVSVAADAASGMPTVYWSSPSNPVLILRMTDASVPDIPANYTTYTVGSTLPGGSKVVYSGSVTERSFSEPSPLTAGHTYYYKVFANSGPCYSTSGVEVNALLPSGTTPAWSYMTTGGSTMRAGIAGAGTIYTTGNFGRIIGLDTTYGTETWAPTPTTQPIQAWLTWLPAYNGWTYRKRITIDHTKVIGGPLSNFPVLISITDSDLKNYAQASGNDILFTASDGTTKLAHEIETYSSATGQLVAWVNVPSLSSSADTVLYMYYGNSTAVNQQNVAGTWNANFNGVWHLKESGNGTAGEFKDSTARANHGQGGGGSSAATPAQVTGEMGYGQSFNGTSQFIKVPDSSSFTFNPSFTVSGWIYPTAWGASGDQYIKNIFADEITPAPNSGTFAFRLGYGGLSTDSKRLGINIMTGTTPPETNNDFESNSDLSLGAWQYVVVTYDGSNVRFYINGGLNNTIPFLSQTPGNPANNWFIGTNATTPPQRYFQGNIDELRLATTALSAGWISTEYNNQCYPTLCASAFLAVGSPEAINGWVVFGADQSGTVYAVDALGGTNFWQVKPNAGTDLFQASIAAQLRQWSDATFNATSSDDLLFVPTLNASPTNNKVYALKARGPAISLVQSTGKFRTGAGSSVQSSAFSTNPVVGNKIIVLAWTYSAVAVPPTSITASDNFGNTYTSDAQSQRVSGSSYWNAAVLSAPVNATGASFKVTVAGAAGTSQVVAVAMEYSGLGSKDQTGTNNGTGGSPTVSTAGATNNANELVASAASVAGSGSFTSIAPAGGYTDRATELDNTGYQGGEGSDKIVSSTGVQSNTWTVSPTPGNWATAIATYSPKTAVWTFSPGNMDYIAGMPWVDYARNRLYVVSRAGSLGDQRSLWVIDTLTGNPVACNPATACNLGHIEASPTMSYDGATLYVGNQAGTLYAINLNTLAQKWSSNIGSALKGFVWEDWNTAGRLYFATTDGGIHCVNDQSSGNPCSGWTVPNVAGASTPLLLTKLFVGSSDGKVHQINLTTGADEKQYCLNPPGSGSCSALAVGDVSTEDTNQIFVPTGGGRLYKLPLPLP